ncbi:MAG: hypothetical protein LLF95_04755 [Bacteroidales bacterium]|nr:hypothetical protein [Bacteroidales bacterium]
MIIISSIEQRRYIFPKILIGTTCPVLAGLAYCLIALLFSSCSETDNYYDTLKHQPEIVKDYDAVYGVGDTMTIKGHLIRDGLKIRIGDAEAEIIGFESRLTNIDLGRYNDSTQYVKVEITQAMGIGTGRPVSVTSSGIAVEGPAIEIIESSSSGLLPHEMTVQKIADYPANSSIVYCHSGNGNMYFINNTTYSVTRMKPDGSTEQVLDASQFVENGAKFNVTRYNGAGIDPQERYLYLSLYTAAPLTDNWNYYRLCRYDLQQKTFEVLNKTPYYIYASRHTLANISPFEGDMDSVKMFAATGVYPDSLGNVYFNMNNTLITRLNANGAYSYVFKVQYYNGAGAVELNDPAPQVYNTATKSEASAFSYFPGVVISYDRVQALDPDGAQFYTRATSSTSLQHYDMVNAVMLNSFSSYLNINFGAKPYLSGSFAVLTGSTDAQNSEWGFLPMAGRRLLILRYQDLADGAYAQQYQLPAWTVLDFDKERGSRYAPGSFDRKGYSMSNDRTPATKDVLINNDADGMLYMTANNKTVILKTVYK